MRSRVAAIEKDITEFRELVEPLARTIGLAPEGPREVAAAADSLIDRLDQASEAFALRKTAVEQQGEAQRAVERQNQRLLSVAQELDDLLATGEAADPEDFRRRAHQHQETHGVATATGRTGAGDGEAHRTQREARMLSGILWHARTRTGSIWKANRYRYSLSNWRRNGLCCWKRGAASTTNWSNWPEKRSLPGCVSSAKP